MSKSVTARWSSGLDFTTESVDGGRVQMAGDEGVEGYRPSALLLAALAGCTAMDVISIIRKKQLAVNAYEVHATGEQRETHPRTFSTIRVEHRVRGTAIDAASVARAIGLSATRYCPVTAHLAMGDVTITHAYVISGDGDEQRADVVITGPAGRGLAPPA